MMKKSLPVFLAVCLLLTACMPDCRTEQLEQLEETWTAEHSTIRISGEQITLDNEYELDGHWLHGVIEEGTLVQTEEGLSFQMDGYTVSGFLDENGNLHYGSDIYIKE